MAPFGRRHFLAKDRRVLHLRPHIHADEADRTRDQKGNAPAPFVHRTIAEMQRIAEHQRRAEGKARERPAFEETHRKSDVKGKRVSVTVYLGGRRHIKKKNKNTKI